FDRFYQIANTDSAQIIGTGIGLSLAKSIVDLHDGEIFAQSKIGKGSTFTIRLPLGSDHFMQDQLIPFFQDSEHESHYQDNQVALAAENLAETVAKKHGLLLIVEDNTEIRAFIRKIFEADFQIMEASNGLKGIQQLERQLPDLIISDVMMPEMDGITFCQQVRENEQTAHIPVILLTARTSTVFQVEGYHSGADAYVSKPFQPAILKAQATGLLARRLKLKEYFSKKVTLQPTEIDITSEEEQFLHHAIQVVEQNLENESFSRDLMADALSMSASTLYRRIKALTGLTTNAFIRSIRLKRAAQLIRDSHYNISEIAYIVGFHDLKYFRKSFKNQFGLKPSEYLRKNEANTT
ncbi:MAG: response regulator, partial [Bacteroidota bacterium]